MANLSFSDVEEILRLLRGVDASTVELEWGDLRLSVRRGNHPAARNGTQGDAETAATPATSETPSDVQPYPTSPVAKGSAGSVGRAAVASIDKVPEHWVPVRAPMAGTFYRSAAPDKPPFAEIGDVVAPGDVVAVVEVMKLFTELKSDTSGKVAQIDAQNASLIEYDDALIWIEPA